MISSPQKAKKEQMLPAILTPTFGDWKGQIGQVLLSDVARPKISKKNPLYDLFQLNDLKRKESNSGHHASPLRDLRSQGSSHKHYQEQFKENYGIENNKGEFLSTMSTNSNPKRHKSSYHSAEGIVQNSDEESKLFNQLYNMSYKQNSKKNPITPTLIKPKIITPSHQLTPNIYRRNNSIQDLESQEFQTKSKQKRNLTHSIQSEKNYLDERDMSLNENSDDNKVLQQNYQRNQKIEQQKMVISQLKHQLTETENKEKQKFQDLFSHCCQVLDSQKIFFEEILKNNSIYYKYSKNNRKQLDIQKKKLKNLYQSGFRQ